MVHTKNTWLSVEAHIKLNEMMRDLSLYMCECARHLYHDVYKNNIVIINFVTLKQKRKMKGNNIITIYLCSG